MCGLAPESILRTKNQLLTEIIKMTKVGRNDPCPCESGKKYKKCCSEKDKIKSQINRRKYYELEEKYQGVPYHNAKRFMMKYTGGIIPPMIRTSVISLICNNAFFLEDSQKIKSWETKFEIAHNLITGAWLQNQAVMDDYMDKMGKELMHFQSNLHFSTIKTEDILSSTLSTREKTQILLKYYHDLYEGYYKCIVSVVTLAKKVLNNKVIPEDLVQYIHADTKIKINELKEDDNGECVPPIPELEEGCNKHIRNAFSHNRWKPKDNLVELWDIDPRTGRKGWEETFTIADLDEITKKLRGTVDAITLADLIFSYSKFTDLSGYFSIAPGEYEFPQIESILETRAFEQGLLLNKCNEEIREKKLNIQICILENLGIEQVTTIYEGSKPPRAFKVPLVHVEYEVYDSILNFLLVVGGALTGYKIINLEVIGEKTGEIKIFEFSGVQLSKFLKKERQNLEDQFMSLKGSSYTMKVEGPSLPYYGDDEEVDRTLAKALAQRGWRDRLVPPVRSGLGRDPRRRWRERCAPAGEGRGERPLAGARRLPGHGRPRRGARWPGCPPGPRRRGRGGDLRERGGGPSRGTRRGRVPSAGRSRRSSRARVTCNLRKWRSTSGRFPPTIAIVRRCSV